MRALPMPAALIGATLACLALLGCGEAESFEGGVRLPESTAEGASWSPDGRWLAIPNKDGVLLRGVRGSGRRQLSAPPMHRTGGSMPGRISWSRDGTEVLYVTTVGPVEHKGGWITSVPLDGGSARQVALGTSIYSYAWAGEWPLVYNTGPSAFSPHGPIGPKPALWEVAALEAPPRRLLNLPGQEYAPEFSPDGSRLLFGFTRSDREAVYSLWSANADGSHPRRLAGPFIDPAYRWSPDGKSVAIIANQFSGDRGRNLYLLSAAGGRLRKLSDEEVDGEPAWTPDGRWITYATYEGRIESIRADGSGRRTLANLDHQHVRDLMWSPDGERLAYSAEEIRESD